jgi:small subunit ribosomal protein S16
MLKIKLIPLGKKHERHFRIVVTEENSKLTGNNSIILGHYHPLTKQLTCNKQAVGEWMKKGAQPTEKIRRLLEI